MSRGPAAPVDRFALSVDAIVRYGTWDRGRNAAPATDGNRMFKGLNAILMGGREVLPLVEGGKGVSATNHMSSGAWALAGGIGTVSAVNADSFDAEGKIIPQIYRALTRRERHEGPVAAFFWNKLSVRGVIPIRRRADSQPATLRSRSRAAILKAP